nr:hypothetical protein GCM10017745_35580 [Saccharothrix mutabilis subsp. capreolus]
MLKTINTSQLNGRIKLPDGDKIRLETTLNAVGSDEIQIALKLKGVSWWKGIQSSHVILCQCQDGMSWSAAHESYAEFTDLGLQLWKAKEFGIHRAIYELEDTDALQPGNGYTFVWLLD